MIQTVKSSQQANRHSGGEGLGSKVAALDRVRGATTTNIAIRGRHI
jgi:hypothetical protein